MREILFRAKRIDNGEWVFGGYDHALQTNIKTGFYKDTHFIMESNGLVNVVDPETVCQYTGLTDKAGRKIFEGDVVNSDLGKIGKVAYNESHLAYLILETSEMKYYFIQECDGGHIEVIGNIFDNPELVESNA